MSQNRPFLHTQSIPPIHRPISRTNPPYTGRLDYRQRYTAQTLPALSHPICNRNREFHPRPRSATPHQIFKIARHPKSVTSDYRFLRKNDTSHTYDFKEGILPAQALVFIDGACLDNGGNTPRGARGGTAVVLGPREQSQSIIMETLPAKGPVHTNNRAELAAALLALRATHWPAEAIDNLVIATDSQYLLNGACDWVHTWQKNDWRTSNGSRVENRDLWEELIERLYFLEIKGCHAQFWWIPRELNEADKYAKQAAASVVEDVPVVEMLGMSIFGGS